jgi:hypothetical protein
MEGFFKFVGNMKMLLAAIGALIGLYIAGPAIVINYGPVYHNEIRVSPGFSWCDVPNTVGTAYRKNGECMKVDNLLRHELENRYRLLEGDIIKFGTDRNGHIAEIIYIPKSVPCCTVKVQRTRVFWRQTSKYVAFKSESANCRSDLAARRATFLDLTPVVFKRVRGDNINEIIRNATSQENETIKAHLIKNHIYSRKMAKTDSCGILFTGEMLVKAFIYNSKFGSNPRCEPGSPDSTEEKTEFGGEGEGTSPRNIGPDQIDFSSFRYSFRMPDMRSAWVRTAPWRAYTCSTANWTAFRMAAPDIS